MTHDFVEHVPVERRLELRPVVGLDDVDAEGKALFCGVNPFSIFVRDY